VRTARDAPTPVDPIIGVRNTKRLRAVAEADLLGHLGDPDLDAVVETLRLACGVPIAVVNIVRSNLQTYPAEVGVGAPCSAVPDGLSFCAEVVDTGLPLAVADAANHPVYSRNPMVLSGVIGAYAGVPLVDNGVVLGSVSIFDGSVREFSTEVLKILGYQGQLAASVIALRRKARTDVLTGLPNRERLLDGLSSAIARLDRHPGLACVLYFDVDEFKAINDTYGHAAGDGVLVELGHRLLTVLRSTDTASRFGGDEFVVACGDLKSVADAERLTARIVQAITADWHVNGQQLNVDVSIGCALTASPTTQPTMLLHDADEAMYMAKQLPGTRSVVSVCRQAAPTRCDEPKILTAPV
jgi:diguanylate cyclase (GGDEF)-like protein